MPIESVLKPILDTVLDAVVVTDREGTILAWNGPASDVFGWAAEEAIGRNVDIIIPSSLREAHHRGMARFNDGGAPRVLDKRLELSGLKRDGSEFPVELSITLLSRDGRDVFVGFLRDISHRHEAERRLAFQLRESQLLLELSELANREGNLEQALVTALDAICELTGWPVGHAFLVEDGGGLRSSAWSSGAHSSAPDLVRGTAEMRFDRGVGLPGRVVESGRPIWISRIADEKAFPRRGLGFESAFAFPAFTGDRCIALFEFFSREPREPEEFLMLSARAVGAQVGRVFERKRSDELRALLLAEIDHRAKNILSVVRGMAHLSFGSATDVAEAQKVFDSRLDSVAKANAVLRGEGGNSASVADIVKEALSGCGAGESRAALRGPDLCVDSTSAIMLSVAVHELCTNAFKYGALSADGGRIDVSWRLSPEDGGRFDLEWVETGGPPPEPSRKKGFGTRILGRGIQLATGGHSEIFFDQDGLRFRLTGARHHGPPTPEAAAA